MGILQNKSQETQGYHLSLIQYLRNKAPGLVTVEAEIVTVEGGTFREEKLSLRVKRRESVHDAMGRAQSAAGPWLQANSNWANEEE